MTPGSGRNAAGPIGEGDYEVRPGDCLLSIAYAAGHFWQTLWDHPRNADLKRARKDPGVLLPGDRIFIPPLREKVEQCGSDTRHKFKLKGVPAKLRLQLKLEDKPRANESYRIEIDGKKVAEGKLDRDGRLEVAIVPDAGLASVFVGEPPDETEYSLRLGHIDPVTEVAGVQQRLMNLGFGCAESGELDGGTEAAIRAFQKARSLTASGELDDATRSELLKAHGC
jgi:hypothetical protein